MHAYEQQICRTHVRTQLDRTSSLGAAGVQQLPSVGDARTIKHSLLGTLVADPIRPHIVIYFADGNLVCGIAAVGSLLLGIKEPFGVGARVHRLIFVGRELNGSVHLPGRKEGAEAQRRRVRTTRKINSHKDRYAAATEV